MKIPCKTSAQAIHVLGGVGGWSFPADKNKSVSAIVRLIYADGQSEDHELINGVHFADYVKRLDVPQSEFAFDLGGRQLRYLSIAPQRAEIIETIELIKGPDKTAPIFMALTIELLHEENLRVKK
jgi:hypothetical protein